LADAKQECRHDRRCLIWWLVVRESRSVDDAVEVAEPVLLLAVAVGQSLGGRDDSR
jgi:hypothetical protein